MLRPIKMYGVLVPIKFNLPFQQMAERQDRCFTMSDTVVLSLFVSIVLLVFNNSTHTALCYFSLSAALRERDREGETEWERTRERDSFALSALFVGADGRLHCCCCCCCSMLRTSLSLWTLKLARNWICLYLQIMYVCLCVCKEVLTCVWVQVAERAGGR